ncbi:MAG: coenzyme-B sulfoethylthiotransferase subunit beta [Candidatus Syntropharchaeales archaeon]
MKYEDKIDLYNDEGKVLAENIPIEALHPYRNPYMAEMYMTLKRTGIVDLGKLEEMLRNGRTGWTSTVGQDEIKMPWYGLDLDLVEDSEEIAEELKKLLQIKEGDDTNIIELEGGSLLVVQLSEELLRRSADYSPAFTRVSVALAQIIAKKYGIDNPLDRPYRMGMLKNCLHGRYPQYVGPNSGNPVSTLMKVPSILEGLGTGFKSFMINHVVALGNNRTLEAVALATIFEQGAQAEMGNSVGWYERAQLLGSAYQGFNANNFVLSMLKENAKGTAYDVVLTLMERALANGVIEEPPNRYPFVQPSGYKLYGLKDYAMWNAYGVATLLCAVIVNCGAMRAAQNTSAVLGSWNDYIAFEGGGLPDPDAGRVMGTGLGFGFYTHGLYGGAGPGAFTMDHVIVRHTSGFLTPCIVAGMCLDAGSQIFRPSVTSGLYYTLADNLPIFQNPLEKVAEAAESVKGEI